MMMHISLQFRLSLSCKACLPKWQGNFLKILQIKIEVSGDQFFKVLTFDTAIGDNKSKCNK